MHALLSLEKDKLVSCLLHFLMSTTVREQLVGLLASSSAGVLSRFPCHPLDTCKARLQVQGANIKYTSLLDTLRQTVKAEGLGGLYRGFGVTVVGSAPATCLYLTSYDYTKNILTSSFFQGHDFAAHFSAGMIAETFSCILWVPIDVTKERLQIQEQGKSSTNYRGSVDALRTIMRTEGVRGMYKGYGATVGSFGPFSAFYFTFYEQFKWQSTKVYYGVENEDKDEVTKDLPFWLHLLNSSTASMMASFVTNPLDLVKLRLQVQRGNQAAVGKEMIKMTHEWGMYRGMLDGLQQIITKEGALGLFRGVGARMAFHGPSMAITIASYEKFKVLCQHLLLEKELQ